MDIVTSVKEKTNVLTYIFRYVFSFDVRVCARTSMLYLNNAL